MQSGKPPPVMPLSVSGCIVGNVVFFVFFFKREEEGCDICFFAIIDQQTAFSKPGARIAHSAT